MAERQTYTTERLGVNAVEKFFLSLGWIFREQYVGDNGIDAQVEVVEDGEPTGKLIALQIKSGASYFAERRNGDYLYRGKLKHLKYWSRHTLPVFLMLHNPDTGETIWQRVESRFCKVAKASWAILVPERNKLDKASMFELAHGLANDEEAYLRHVFSLDIEFMERFEDREAIMTWEVWVNKHLGLRNATFEFEGGERVEFNDYYLGHDIHHAMARYYPWLEYTDMEEVEEVAFEYEIHKLEVSLRPEARAFLTVERFFKEGIVQQYSSEDSDVYSSAVDNDDRTGSSESDFPAGWPDFKEEDGR